MPVLRTRVLLALLVVLGLGSFGLALPFSGAATGSDPDGSVTVSDTSPVAGSSIGVTLAGLDPTTTVSVQLCVGFFLDTGPGAPGFPLVYDPAGCRALGELTTDGAGAAAGPVTLPPDGYALGGRCAYEPGPGSFSFGGQSVADCVLIATTDATPADGVAALASTRLRIGLGTGSISGTIRDGATGSPIASANGSASVVVCALDATAGCASGANWFFGGGSGGVTVNADGTYAVEGLGDGRYVVSTTAFGTGSGSDFRTVAVTGGAAVTDADLAVPAAGAPTWANSGGTAVVAVSPSVDVAYDATLDVSGGGFQPGDRVTVHLCPDRGQPVFTNAATGSLAPVCAAAPLAGGADALVADGAGEVQGQVPFDLQRFQGGCSNYYADFGAAALSFQLDPSCRLLLFDGTDEPSAAWTEVDFVRPPGVASITGAVTADGVPVKNASVTVSGPIGNFARTTDDSGVYRVADQPDATSTIYARLPSNYFFDGGNATGGPGSFSFGLGPSYLQQEVTVSGGADVVADLDFDILPGAVTGTLLDADGAVPDYGWVYLTPATNGTFVLSGQIGPDGGFELRGLPDGTYSFYASATSGTTFGSLSRTVTITGGEVVDLELRLPRFDSSIAGTVVDEAGTPLSGAYVSACPESGGTSFGRCVYGPTGPGGSFQLTGLAADTYRLIAYSPLSPLVQATTVMTVAEGQALTGVELRFRADTGTITGTVRSDAGTAIEGATVYACGTGGLGACATTTTDAAGGYTVNGAPDGDYVLQAWAEGFNSSSTTATVTGGGTTDADLTLSAIRVVPPDTSVGGVDGDTSTGAGPLFRSSPSPVVIEGQCAGATVTFAVTGADGTPWTAGSLSETGVPGTYAGEIPPQPSRSGHGELTITVDCPDGEQDPAPVEIDVYIDPSGNVVDTEGNPVAGATVTLLRSDTEAGPFTQVPDGSSIMSPENRTNPDLTDENGAFGWLTLAGYYKVRAEKAGCNAPGDPSTPTVETPALPVPPEQVGLVLVLECGGGDQTPPDVSLVTDSAPNAAGWDDSVVSVSAQATDAGGLASTSLVFDGVETGSTQEILGDGVRQVAATATDTAGNSATSEPVTIRVDTVDPTATVSAPAQGASVVAGTPLALAAGCTDSGSGIESCTATLDGSPVAIDGAIDTTTPGPRSVAVTATDVAGRTTTTRVDFTVSAPSAGDQVLLRFTGSISATWDGALTGGDIKVRKDLRGQISSITGTGTLPGRNGGDAKVTFDVQRVNWLGTYLGSIRIIDSGARVAQTTPVLFSPVRVAADGTVSGSTQWFTGLFQGYRLQWSVLDRPAPPG